MKRVLLAVLLFWQTPSALAEELNLWMAETKGCYWCARWNEEIADIYPKTTEGKLAPLKRYNLRRDDPDIAFQRKVTYTPTFILVRDGQEVGRIEGYPGEDFFWAILKRTFIDAKIELNEAS